MHYGEKYEPGTHEAKYGSLRELRWQYLKRAQAASRVTLPYLCDDWSNEWANFTQNRPYRDVQRPSQSLGAMGTTNLSAKVKQALFSPGTRSFFKVSFNQYEIQKELAELGEDADQVKQDMDSNIMLYEEEASKPLKTPENHIVLSEAIDNALVAGNVVVEVKEDMSLCLYQLPYYVVERDRAGNLYTLILRESYNRETLPPAVKEFLMAQGVDLSGVAPYNEDIPIYTGCIWNCETEKFDCCQECRGYTIPDTSLSYTKDDFPYIVVRAVSRSGEPYGRGVIETRLYNDLTVYDSLSYGLTEFAGLAVKCIPLLRPGSVLAQNQDKLLNAENGQPVLGRPDDLSFAQIDKLSDMSIVLQQMQTLETRINETCLRVQGSIRQAERVTTVEVQAVIKELETSWSALFASMSASLAAPLAKIVVKRMEKAKKLPALSDTPALSDPEVFTGLEALGRGQDYQATIQWLQNLAELNILHEVNLTEAAKALATSLGLRFQPLMKTDEQKQEEAQMAQQARTEDIEAQAAGAAVQREIQASE